ncbi:MAG: imidazoleglycerol-phosphate dehydratase HisB [Phycisphaerales bacterium]|nr:imidazoleglycerol-phosphate dehydratase HisB [Phycisphaerales bacterium]
MTTPAPRAAEISRATNETEIACRLSLDGCGEVSVATGLGFFDHMLSAMFTHARFDLSLECKGDLEVDDHHTIEDCAIVLGRAVDQALSDRRGIERFASAYAPLDEALARCVIDLDGRGSASIELGLVRPIIGAGRGQIACENLTHFLRSFALSARAALHVDVLKGENDHHRAEAAFKATALVLRQSVRLTGEGVPSTKGVL